MAKTKTQKETEINIAEENNPALGQSPETKLIEPGEILPMTGGEITQDPVTGSVMVAPGDLLAMPDQTPGQLPEPTQAAEPGAVTTDPGQAAEPVPATPEPKKRSRGRPPGSRNRKPGDLLPGGQVDFSDIATIAEITPEAAATDYQALAEMSFDMSVSSLAIVFSDDWKPKDDNERNAVITALKRYFEHKQVKDIPPGALLAIVLCAYAAPRVNQPTTRDKLKMGWTWLKTKIGRKKA